MKRQCLQKFASVFFGFCISLSFFISSFADAFTGAYLYTGVDPVTGQPIVEVRGVNPTGQTFSGSNVIEMNAYNNAPILTSNTFNGTTSIDPAYTDITSNGNTYNGTTTITYDGITGGQLESNNDTFATANVNTSNADVELNNPTFNGNTTLQAQNVSLGSISQMDALIARVMMIGQYLNTTAWSGSYTGEPSVVNMTVTYGSVTLTEAAPRFVANYWSFDPNTHELVNNTLRMRSNFFYFTSTIVTFMANDFKCLFDILDYYLLGNKQYTIYQYSYGNNENLTYSATTITTDFRTALINRFDCLIMILRYISDKFFNWYYPLDNVAPEYWRYYNTDTGLSEDIGLAGLYYNISWYLGEIYQNLTDAGSDMTSDAQQLGSSISALNTAEESVNTQIQSAFSTVSGIMTLPVISSAALCISWIEYMWGSIGIFQSPTLLAYMCVILMMLVGFAKYRSAFR